MKVYRTNKDGIDIWKLSGVVEREDALVLVHLLEKYRRAGRGCFILDFGKVMHVDYRVFQFLEDWFQDSAGVILSGFNDYVLDIFAFAKKGEGLPVYPDWRNALRHLMVERGKISSPLAANLMGNK